MQQNKDFLFTETEQDPLLIADLLQRLFFEEFTGKLDLTNSEANGVVYIENGDPVHAQFGKKEGVEALLDLLLLRSPSLHLTPGFPSPSKMITNKLETILTESALRLQNLTGRMELSSSDPSSVKSNSLLEIQNPNGEKSEFPLLQNEISIGRVKSNVLVIPDISLSSHHALIFMQGGSYRIKDLNSSNGTLLNGTRIRESVLKNGDVIHLGKVIIQFQSRLKRPQIQQVTKAQLKNPTQKTSKNSELRISRALRLGDEEMKASVPKTFQQKNLIFFFFAIFLLLSIGGAYYYLRILHK